MPDGMPGPLERAEAIRDRVVRIVFAVGLLFLFLIGLIEAAVFLQLLFRPHFAANAIVLAVGTIGSSSMLISLWTLLQVRRCPLWRLILLSAISAVFAALGWTIVIGAAH
jgi:hypothetical protein